MLPLSRQEAAWWLALSFYLDPPRTNTPLSSADIRKARNALVLTADRVCGLKLMDLILLEPMELPDALRPHRELHHRLQGLSSKLPALLSLVDELSSKNIQLLPITATEYPLQLAKRLKPAYAPTLLFVAGKLELLKNPGLGFRASRKADTAGLGFARAVAEAALAHHAPLICGLETGAETEALYAVLAGKGEALGVAAEGILECRFLNDSSVKNQQLMLLSDALPSSRWTATNAVSRARTLAGLCSALIANPGPDGEEGVYSQLEEAVELHIPVYVPGGDPPEGAAGLNWQGGPLLLPHALKSLLPVPEPRIEPVKPPEPPIVSEPPPEPPKEPVVAADHARCASSSLGEGFRYLLEVGPEASWETALEALKKAWRGLPIPEEANVEQPEPPESPAPDEDDFAHAVLGDMPGLPEPLKPERSKPVEDTELVDDFARATLADLDEPIQEPTIPSEPVSPSKPVFSETAPRTELLVQESLEDLNKSILGDIGETDDRFLSTLLHPQDGPPPPKDEDFLESHKEEFLSEPVSTPTEEDFAAWAGWGPEEPSIPDPAALSDFSLPWAPNQSNHIADDPLLPDVDAALSTPVGVLAAPQAAPPKPPAQSKAQPALTSAPPAQSPPKPAPTPPKVQPAQPPQPTLPPSGAPQSPLQAQPALPLQSALPAQSAPAQPPPMLSLPKSPATSQDIILDALKEGDPGGMSIQELSDITGLSEGRLEKRLKGLISSRQVETIRSGRTEKYGIKGARRW